VGSAVFKTDVGREERPGCVRFARASAMRILRKPDTALMRAGRRDVVPLSLRPRAGKTGMHPHISSEARERGKQVSERASLGDREETPSEGGTPSDAPASAPPDLRRRLRRRVLWATIGVVFLVAAAGSLVYTEESAFCPSCHEMEPYYSAWQTSAHADGAECVECHVDPGVLAHLAHKPIALRELWNHLTRDNKFPNYAVAVPDNRCTGCHPSVDKKIGSSFSHVLHQEKGRCQDCHATSGHVVTLDVLRSAGILKEGAGPVPIPTGVTPSKTAGHKPVVCQECHDQAKMKCTQCHEASHDPLGECSICHKTGEAFVFAHPLADVDCSSCHKKPSEHTVTDDACTSCHKSGGASWAFVHPAGKDCGSCHTAPKGHYGTGCADCHTPRVAFSKARFIHRGDTGEHSYRSFACAKCHPSSFQRASCTCHGGSAPQDD